jgi:hypothetical protein
MGGRVAVGAMVLGAILPAAGCGRDRDRRPARPAARTPTTAVVVPNQLGDLSDSDDPATTARALERRGYKVRWVLIEHNPDYRRRRLRPGDRFRPQDQPTVATPVAAPPPGTRVLSVLNEHGGAAPIPGSRSVTIEVTPRGSKGLDEEP